MKTAVIQVNATTNKAKNIQKALCLVQEAAEHKAEFILLPEAFNYRGKASPRKGYSAIAERIPGPSVIPLMEIAKKRKVSILAGTVCEKIHGQRKVYNTSVLIDRGGKIIGKYRKSHLFDAKIGGIHLQESKNVSAGKRITLVRIGSWHIGLTICYDLRFPDLYQRYAQKGANVLCVPSAFTRVTGRAHWEVLLRARAVENRCYVLAPDQTGRDGRGIPSYGNSMIIDPWGNILARASGEKQEIIYARLDKRFIRKRSGILTV
jgi:predicted amidohydrolase